MELHCESRILGKFRGSLGLVQSADRYEPETQAVWLHTQVCKGFLQGRLGSAVQVGCRESGEHAHRPGHTSLPS